jgi:hypothetical protein
MRANLEQSNAIMPLIQAKSSESNDTGMNMVSTSLKNKLTK